MTAKNEEDLKFAYLVCTDPPGLSTLIDKGQKVLDGWFSKKLMSEEFYKGQTLAGKDAKEHCNKVERLYQTYKITKKIDPVTISEIDINLLTRAREVIEDDILSRPNLNEYVEVKYKPNNKPAPPVSVKGGSRKNHRLRKSRRQSTRRSRNTRRR